MHRSGSIFSERIQTANLSHSAHFYLRYDSMEPLERAIFNEQSFFSEAAACWQLSLMNGVGRIILQRRDTQPDFAAHSQRAAHIADPPELCAAWARHDR